MLPRRVVTGSLADTSVPSVATLSPRVTLVLGANPGWFTGPGTNTYLVGTGSRPVLIDTGQGMPEYRELLRHTRESVRPCEGLRAVALTHGHFDHMGGVGDVLAEFGPVPVYKMPDAADPATLALEPLEEGSVVSAEGATLRVLWTPGHARDHVCFFLEEEKALFTGDVVLGAGTTVIPEDGDLAAYLRSLQRLLELDARILYPGHGPPVENPARKIREYLAHRELRERQILDALADGALSVAELVAAIYTDVPAVLHQAAGWSVRAHLRKLEAEGRVRREQERWQRLRENA
ncbi:MAG: MBL fold hydrolase [Candidatus Binatia bacterium]|nr:MAG: MBL fold hydrolase [Candidatus Binatia bacterium]